MDQNTKLLLKRNVVFFAENKQRAILNDPQQIAISKQVIKKINEMIDNGDIGTMLNVEAVYEFCFEKMQEDTLHLDAYAAEIASFMS